MTWRARKAAVAEQQADAGPTKREYPGMRRAAAGVAAGMEAPFTVVSNGGATETFADGADAYLAARSKWSANPLGGRVFVYDNRGETVADFDF